MTMWEIKEPPPQTPVIYVNGIMVEEEVFVIVHEDYRAKYVPY